ncbi:hypothetical protein ASD50_06375 [Mesorhizobium sp. Root552]|uniref:hypothetical protein n=1 Tax=Mesorhizobium sp. Root552 TaxID=1736555 RepID=UPI0006FBC69D|nr:hypothetical protein [Mesorhizobium sp. Root552]KQZ19130.1 hypothetical protein ASD50_06375 [Mesorhizobium sp. Root552]
MAYSVQQIKFEFLGLIKEYGQNPDDWFVGTAEDVHSQLFDVNSVDESGDTWVWKPTLSPSAAKMIHQFLVYRIGVRPAFTQEGPIVFMFKRKIAAKLKSQEARSI